MGIYLDMGLAAEKSTISRYHWKCKLKYVHNISDTGKATTITEKKSVSKWKTLR